MQVGERLKAKRLALNLTQEEVASQLYISRQTLSNWENNRTLPDIHSLILLSELYHVSLDELTTKSPELPAITRQQKHAQLANLIMLLGCVIVPLSLVFLSDSPSIIVSVVGFLCILFNQEIAQFIKRSI